MKYDRFIQAIRLELDNGIKLSIEVSPEKDEERPDAIKIVFSAFWEKDKFRRVGGLLISKEIMYDPNIETWDIIIDQIVKSLEYTEFNDP